MNGNKLKHELNALHAGLCAAVADPNRIMILYELKQGPKYVGELAEALGLSQSATSRHLKILKNQEIVASQRKGHRVTYHLITPQLIDALDIFRAVLSDQLEHRVKLINEERKE